MQIIDFWDERDAYGWLSNFYNAPIVIDGREWATSEHYYQAHKHLDNELFEQIAQAPTAAKAKRLAKKLPHAISENDKIAIMRKAIAVKFTQHQDLKALLLATGNNPIVEGSPRDPYWGVGEDGQGINMMGMLLMELRCKIQSTFSGSECCVEA